MKIAGLNRKGYTAWGSENTLKGVGTLVWKTGSLEVKLQLSSQTVARPGFCPTAVHNF